MKYLNFFLWFMLYLSLSVITAMVIGLFIECIIFITVGSVPSYIEMIIGFILGLSVGRAYIGLFKNKLRLDK